MHLITTFGISQNQFQQVSITRILNLENFCSNFSSTYFCFLEIRLIKIKLPKFDYYLTFALYFYRKEYFNITLYFTFFHQILNCVFVKSEYLKKENILERTEKLKKQGPQNDD